MSHAKQRKEADCLNCGTIVQGRYCHVCGQENIETKESFWSLVKHFVFDILHFDGNFWRTIRRLFTKPGMVAKEYVNGRRVPYVHPIRIYLFASAIFFLSFFSLEAVDLNAVQWSENFNNRERDSLAQLYTKRLSGTPKDSIYTKRIALLRDTVHFPRLSRDSFYAISGSAVPIGDGAAISFSNSEYRTVADYDSAQARLPASERDGWFGRRMNLQSIKINNKYKGPEGARRFFDGLLHRMPYLLFVSLPFFAALLRLLYWRRKQFYYSDHAVFTLYHYVLTFLLLLLIFGIDGLGDWSGWQIFDWLEALLGILWPVYLYLQMKTFYGQGWGKTFIKFLLLNALGLILITILFGVFLFFSIFQA